MAIFAGSAPYLKGKNILTYCFAMNHLLPKPNISATFEQNR